MRCNETELKFGYGRNPRGQSNAVECRTSNQDTDDWDLDENDVHIERTDRGIFLSPSDSIQVRTAFGGERAIG